MYVSLKSNKRGNIAKYTGNLALIAAAEIGADECGGTILASEEATALDYIMLAVSVCRECLKSVEDNEANINLMRECLAVLFE